MSDGIRGFVGELNSFSEVAQFASAFNVARQMQGGNGPSNMPSGPMGPGQGSSHANAPEKSESEMRSHIESLVEKAISTRVPTRRADTNSTMAEGHD
eukprot:7768805-Karenia_brevis.AAC.1